jgi:hypothetical protein
MLPTGLNRAAVHVDVDALTDASAASLGEKLLGRGAADVWSPQKLRRQLRKYVGSLSPEAYLRPAMIVALGEFVEPVEMDRMNDGSLRRVGRVRVGDKAAVDLPVLRAAVGAFVMGYEPDLPTETDAAAARLLDASDLGTWRERHRYGLQHSSAERIGCLRGHAGLVQAMAILVDAPIIAGVSSVGPNPHPTGEGDIWVYRNAAVRFDPAGIAEGEYAKMHLVPFSEYVPFKYSWPAFHSLLRGFVPPSMPQLEPGQKPSRFFLTTSVGKRELATPICYEGTFATVCRRMVRAGEKRFLILANLSNDGWFTHRGAYWDWLLAGFRNDPHAGPWQGTTEQSQHLSHYAYRAVELRVPIVRAVNTGISAHIDSNGRLQSVVQRMAGDDRQTTMIAGTLAVRPLVDSRLTVYSLVGDLFAITVTVAAGFLVAWMIWRNRRDAST